jgi:transposase-like protein
VSTVTEAWVSLALCLLIGVLLSIRAWRRRHPVSKPVCPNCRRSKISDYGTKMVPRYACEKCGQMFDWKKP